MSLNVPECRSVSDTNGQAADPLAGVEFVAGPPTRRVTIAPGGVYTKTSLAAALEVTEKTIERWSQQPSEHLPAPFYQGRRPCWTGAELLRFFAARQARAVEAVAI